MKWIEAIKVPFLLVVLTMPIFYVVGQSSVGGSVLGRDESRQIVEAESGVFTGAVDEHSCWRNVMLSDAPHSTHSGKGAVDTKNEVGSFVEVVFDARSAGPHRISVRYTHIKPDPRPGELRVNGIVVNPLLAMPRTDALPAWNTASTTANLIAGKNVIRLSALKDGGLPNMDYVKVAEIGSRSQPDLPLVKILEVEDGVFSGTVDHHSCWQFIAMTEAQHSSPTGRGFVDTKNEVGSYVEVPFETKLGGPHTVSVRYVHNKPDDRSAAISVNGVAASPSLAFPQTGAWTAWKTVSAAVQLKAGRNAIRITALHAEGLANIDHFEFVREPQGNAAPLAIATAEQWGVFEVSLIGPKVGNPFIDVELSAGFVQGNREVRTTGFYDGDGVYKIRFMPDSVGEWRYETTSNRPDLNGKTGVLKVTPPSSRNRGPVRVRNTHHFAYADGTPYFQLGTTAYSWLHRSEAQQNQTLKTLGASPFNKIRMCVFPQDNADGLLQYFPYEGKPPRNWNTERFDPAFFRNLEKRVGELRDLGIEADLILFHPYDTIWGFNAMDAANDDRYLRYVVARLAAFRNVWWSMANEYDFIKEKKESDWDRIFKVVQASDPYGRLSSIHNGFQIYNHSQDWVSHASIQNGSAVLDPERAVLYRDVYRKPIVYDEVKYEGDSPRRWGQLSAEEMVMRFWNGLVAGTYVGHSEIFGGFSDRWLAGGGTMHGKSVPRLAFFKKVMEAGPPEGFEPIDKWQERRTGGKAGEHYLVYFGSEKPTAWPFVLYKTGLADGMKFSVEVIDTWNMTITPVAGVFEAKKRDEYVFADKGGRAVTLPGQAYMALRIRRQT